MSLSLSRYKEKSKSEMIPLSWLLGKFEVLGVAQLIVKLNIKGMRVSSENLHRFVWIEKY